MTGTSYVPSYNPYSSTNSYTYTSSSGNVFYSLYQQFGIFNLVAPFLLIFALIYGLLRKTQIFKNVQNADRIYAVIAFVISLYYIYSVGLVNFTQTFLAFFFYEMIILFMILLALSLLNLFSSKEENYPELETAKRNISAVITGLLGLTVLFAFLYAASSSSSSFGQGTFSVLNAILYELIYSGLIYILVIVVIFIGVIYWMTKPSNVKPKKPGVKEYLKALAKAAEEAEKAVSEEEKGGRK